MKKVTLCLMTSCMLFFFTPTQLKAETTAAMETTTASAEADANYARLVEIKEMDMSTLSRAEKDELRSEVRAIKADVDEQNSKDAKTATNDGTVYISVGGSMLLLIILLLILL